MKNTVKNALPAFMTFLFLGTMFLGFISVEASGTITYSGHVYNEGGTPLSGADITLAINDDLVPKYAYTTTSGSGYYSVSRSYDSMDPEVDVALFADKDGYVRGSYGAYHGPGSYTHNFYLEEEPDATLVWESPSAGALITFPPGDNDFTFSYSATELDEVRIYIGPSGTAPTTLYGTFTTMGSNIQKTVDLGSNWDDLHGMVRADLRGYISGTKELEATRSFNFSKVITEVSEMLEEGSNEIGSELYLIIYDPPGDESYSTHTVETAVTRTNSISVEAGVSVEVELKASLFNIGADAKFGVDLTYGFEHQWSQTDIDTTEMSSSINTEDRDLVGPGYGDLYWGELEVFVWEVWATTRTYADGTIIYADPIVYSGIDYSENILVSYKNAPPSWLAMNPNLNSDLYDDPSIVNLIQQNSQLEGGTGYVDVTHEDVSSTTTSHSVTLGLSYSTKVKLGLGSTEVEVHVEAQYQHDTEITDSVKTRYYIHDEDSEDYFHYDVGTDLRFGTPIFRNTPNENPLFTSKSSDPWEYNTRDVLPPVGGEPVITLDTDGDGISPTQDDSPLIEVEITDEAAIATATIVYSADEGDSWNDVSLTQIAETDIWYGNIPAYPHGTTIEWYIYMLDENGNSDIVRDLYGFNFEYTIISRQPTVTLISPNAGGTFAEEILVQWSGDDPDGDNLTYTLGYKIDGGGWILIVEDIVEQQYLWDISGISDSDSVELIIYADDGYTDSVFDTTDFVFVIDNEDIPEVTINAPLSSFTYEGTVSVSWSVVDPDDFVTGFELYYSTTSGPPTWSLINDLIAIGQTSFDWDSSAIIYSTSVRLRLVALNSLDETVEHTTGLFAIDNGPEIDMNLINPNGGEVITTGTTITWNIDCNNPAVIYNITLEYSADSVNWTTIVTNINGSAYQWDTSELPSGTNYRVRITLTPNYLGVDLKTLVDISENAFIITDTTIGTGIPLIGLFAILPFAVIPSLLLRKRSKKK
jgi:hypothetical protein